MVLWKAECTLCSPSGQGLSRDGVCATRIKLDLELTAPAFGRHELLYWADTYADDLPYWSPMPGGEKQQGLVMMPCERDSPLGLRVQD